MSLNLTEKYVVLEKGVRVAFEKLLIATGGKPFVPEIEGADKEGVFTFTKLSDAECLAAKIEKAKSAVVVGGGLIGVSVTEALVKCGLKVTMVELQEKILSLILDSAASEMLENVIKKAGVTIITGQSVRRILGRSEDDCVVGGVTLTNGDQLQCDIVIITIGIIPSTELVSKTDVKTNRGILVDRFMRTTVPDVYASGDVAEAYDFISGENRLLPLLPLAQLEGRVAGYNMAGKKAEYPGGTAMSALKYFNTPIISIGLVNPKKNDDYEVLTKRDSEKKLYKKVVLKENVIVGILLINDIEGAGILFNLMKNGVNIKKFKRDLLSESFSLATLPSSLRKKLYLE